MSEQATLVERLRKGKPAYTINSGTVYAGPTAIETEAADRIAQLERDLAEARAEAERWAEQALKEEDCRKMWQAERDRLAADNAQLRQALTPFAGDKLPTAKRTKIDYNRWGLRCAISPLELARDRARASLQNGEKGE